MTAIGFPQTRLLAGFSRVDITPPVGIYHRMWGAARHDQATGVHRPLTATALVLSSRGADPPQHAKYLLAVDHCLLWPQEMSELLDRLSEHCHVARDHVHVCFSHTHGAGLMGRERSQLPGGDLIEPYLEELAVRCGRALELAKVNQQPAVLVTGVGRCDLARNRDYWDEQAQQFVCGFNPLATADDRVVVGRIANESGQVLGTLVNYACHPTTLAWENTLISPDYIGAMREVVEEVTEAPCFFLLGACGDVGPREGFVGETQVADRNGRSLGYAALATLQTMPPVDLADFAYAGPVASGATLGTWEYRACSASRLAALDRWNESRATVDLKYANDFPDETELQAERALWLERQEAALQRGDDSKASEARAMIERVDRSLIRYGSLPPGDSYPYRPRVWMTGDIVWVMLDGEFYNGLQIALRERFPAHCIIVGTVVNGSSVWYLPDKDSYGKGLYQEQASVLAAGSLERVIETVGDAIQGLVDGSH